MGSTVPHCSQPSSLVKSQEESEKSCSENTEIMKTKDLSENIPSDLSNLPFSMPKLERRIKESRVSSFGSSSMRIESTLESTKPCLDLAPPSSLNLSHPTKQLRPASLSSFNPPVQTKPSITQLKLPLQRPGSDINKPAGLQLNLSQSVDVDVSIPLENQE